MRRLKRKIAIFLLLSMGVYGCQQKDAISDLTENNQYSEVAEAYKDVKADVTKAVRATIGEIIDESTESPNVQITDIVEVPQTEDSVEKTINAIKQSYGSIPEFIGQSSIDLGKSTLNVESTEGCESYSELDELGRPGRAYAVITKDMMPTEERGEIGHIKPAGWHTVKYPDIIEDNYLYNRCHLIAYCLTGQNDNPLNLITGTRYLNVEGMLPYEIKVARYIENTGNPVAYCVTPIYVGDELLCRGVEMEAKSVGSDDINFRVYVFNVQPGIDIDYATGESRVHTD